MGEVVIGEGRIQVPAVAIDADRMARRNAASGQRPIPVSASGVIFEE